MDKKKNKKNLVIGAVAVVLVVALLIVLIVAKPFSKKNKDAEPVTTEQTAEATEAETPEETEAETAEETKEESTEAETAEAETGEEATTEEVTEAETEVPTKAPEVKPTENTTEKNPSLVKITAAVNGSNFKVGDTLTTSNIIVTAYFDNGAVITGVDGWIANTLKLTSTSNTIAIAFADKTCTVVVPAKKVEKPTEAPTKAPVVVKPTEAPTKAPVVKPTEAPTKAPVIHGKNGKILDTLTVYARNGKSMVFPENKAELTAKMGTPDGFYVFSYEEKEAYAKNVLGIGFSFCETTIEQVKAYFGEPIKSNVITDSGIGYFYKYKDSDLYVWFDFFKKENPGGYKENTLRMILVGDARDFEGEL